MKTVLTLLCALTIAAAAVLLPRAPARAQGGTEPITAGNADQVALIATLDAGATIYTLDVEFNPAGTVIATATWDLTDRGGASVVWLWTLDDFTSFASLTDHPWPVISMLFTPNSNRLFTAGISLEDESNPIRMWNGRTGDGQALMEGHTWTVPDMAMRNDGAVLASASWDSTVRLWNGFTGEALTALEGHADDVQDVTFSSIGALASASSDGTVWIWNSVSGFVMNILIGHSGDVNAIDFAPDGDILASGSRDATVRLWDVETGETLTTLEASAPVRDVKYSPDGTVLAALDEGGLIWLWDAASGEALSAPLLGADPNVKFIFSPDGSLLVSAAPDGRIQLWDVAGAALAAVLDGHAVDATSQAYTLAFNPDGSLLATGGSDGGARLWGIP